MLKSDLVAVLVEVCVSYQDDGQHVLSDVLGTNVRAHLHDRQRRALANL